MDFKTPAKYFFRYKPKSQGVRVLSRDLLCPGCGEHRTLRWKGWWCSQRCAAIFGTRMLDHKESKKELYCRECGEKECGSH